ncbi:SYSM protein, partial [Scytalopus superciliaris]|nr:SYSM protein [Scytalopus superciliaris]
RVVCSSTCYRAETDTGREPWGLYRVHQFTKVLGAGGGPPRGAGKGGHSPVCPPKGGDAHPKTHRDAPRPRRVLDMPTEELGLPAYRKFDVEAWMPGRGKYGEVRGG